MWGVWKLRSSLAFSVALTLMFKIKSIEKIMGRLESHRPGRPSSERHRPPRPAPDPWLCHPGRSFFTVHVRTGESSV